MIIYPLVNQLNLSNFEYFSFDKIKLLNTNIDSCSYVTFSFVFSKFQSHVFFKDLDLMIYNDIYVSFNRFNRMVSVFLMALHYEKC